MSSSQAYYNKSLVFVENRVSNLENRRQKYRQNLEIAQNLAIKDLV